MIYLTPALGLLDRLATEDQLPLRTKLLQQRGSARRSAGISAARSRYLSAVVSCAAETNQLLTEVKALVDLSRFCLFENRRRCLEVAERALVRSRGVYPLQTRPPSGCAPGYHRRGSASDALWHFDPRHEFRELSKRYKG